MINNYVADINTLLQVHVHDATVKCSTFQLNQYYVALIIFPKKVHILRTIF